METIDLYGLFAPVFTPFNEDGDINFDVIPTYAEYLSKSKITGILIGGTTGEFASLNVKERNELVDAWMKVAGPLNLKVMVQVGGAALTDVIKMAQHAEKLKADAIMTLPELYFRPKTSENLVSYLEIVSKAAPSLPLLYYHFPMMTGVNLNVNEFFTLARKRVPNFVGMKADLSVATQLDDQQIGKVIYIANHMLAPSALMGYESSIATVNNIFPSLVREIVESTRYEVGNARLQQDKLNFLVNGIASCGDFVPSMKAAMVMVTGIKVGPPRMPQKPLNDELNDRMNRILKTYGY